LDIAIVGLGCRFPQAPDPLSYWDLVRNGTVAFRDIPASRWNHGRLFLDSSLRTPDKAYIARGAYLEDDEVREFGALHFGIAPRRVQVTDPQHRLLLDVVRCALQDAGWERKDFPRRRAGVFIGASVSEYKEMHLSRLRVLQMLDGQYGRKPDPETARALEALVQDVTPLRAFSMPGNLLNMTAAIVAQQFDLGGPALSIDAACSSALVATHQAVTNLRAGQIDIAVAGGVYLNLLPDNLVCFSRIGAISRSGECRPFDAKADGFVMGEGVGAVILKRAADAERDGDRIYALIRGSACNNDGRSEGPMTPRQGGQLEALRLAYEDAGFPPKSVGYIEAHGTATTVGDVVEVGALAELFREQGWTSGDGAQTALGSVKANIGHTMSAAGIAGLIKCALALHHRTLPPQPSVTEHNPKLGLGDGPFFLPAVATPWEIRDGHPRRAAVSSFGFGGTNAHMVLQEAPRPERVLGRRPRNAQRRAELFLLSAARPGLLARHARALAAALAQLEQEGASPADVARTLAARSHGAARLAVTAESFAQLRERLETAAPALDAREAEMPPPSPEAEPPPYGPVPLAPGISFAQGPFPEVGLVLLFPGQGSQKVGLLREMYEHLPAFRETLDRLDESLGAELHAALGGSLRSYLYPEVGGPDAERRLTQTQVCQPAMAAVGLALDAMLRRLGVTPHVVLGHSLGEFAAAAAGGILSDEDCVRLVARRGLLMVGLKLDDCGAMASAAADPDAVQRIVAAVDGVVLANLNHPKQTVISGPTGAVKRASAALEERGVKVTPLDVSHAFHSPIVAPVAQGMEKVVAELSVTAPRLPVISGVTAAPYPDDPRDIRRIWVEHATARLDFAGALRRAAEMGGRVWVNLGAGTTLSAFAKATIAPEQRVAQLGLASREDDGLAGFANAIGLLWTVGVPVEPLALFEGRDAQLVTLPPTPIQTQPYWLIERQPSSSEPLALASRAVPVQNGADMDPLVALFREQIALLQAQARIVQQQADALAQQGVAVPAEVREAIANVAPANPATKPAAPVTAATLNLNGASAAPETRATKAEPQRDTSEIARQVLGFVSRISAFPVEALKTSQTLAGEVGFDSLMTVELDSDIQKTWPGIGGLPRTLLGPQTTIQDVIDHVASALAGPRAAPAAPMLSAALGALADASPELLRFAPVAAPSPLRSVAPAEDPLPHGVLVTRDRMGVAEIVARRLDRRGHAVTVVDCGTETDATALLSRAAETVGPIGVVLHLAALEQGGSLDGVCWDALLWSQRLARAHSGSFVVATAQDGKLGTESGTLLGAALAAHAKALARERSDALVKAIDLDPKDGAEAMADALLTELRSGSAAPEVGVRAGVRYEPDFEPAAAGEPVSLGSSDVVLVTGGGRGVGAKLAVALAGSGCSLVLIGRREKDARVEATLASIRAAGARATYVQWDVTTPAGSALDAARAELGPLTAIVHAAGVAEDGGAAAKDDSTVLRVLAPKVAGLSNTLAATSADPIRAIVLVSSWAGRFGNAGQVDYSAANAALSRAAQLLPALRSGVRALALEYPPWDGTTMVARIPAFARAALAEQGVPFIDDRAGEQALLSALQAGASGPVLLATAHPERSIAHRVTTSVTRRDHVYLDDHQLAGHPVLPMASALDAMAAAALEASGASGSPILIRDFQLKQPVRISDAAQLAVTVHGDAHPHAEMAVSLSASTDGKPPRVPSYVAFATAGGDVAPTLASAVPAPPRSAAPVLPMALEDFYENYTFHGPRLRAIVEIEQISSSGIVGWVKTSRPADWIREPRHEEWTVDPLALDGAFQLAAYWAWAHLQRAGFPVGIQEYVQLAPLPKGPLRATLSLEQSAGEELRGSIVLQAHDGRVLAVARGVEGEFRHRDPRFLRARGPGAKPAYAAASAPTPPQGTARVANGNGANGNGRPASAPAAQPAARPAPQVDEANYRIEQFPEVQELEQRLGLIAAFGLKNPYFNVHERVTNDTSVIAGRTMINWSSYNYLGLSGDPHVSRAAQDAIERYGTSVSASRVASGEKPLHRELEQELARFLGCEDAVVTVSGHGVFVTVIGHMMGPQDLILHDSLAHDCIMGGSKLSGAKRRPFPHNDPDALEKQLAQLRPHYRRVLIAVEGVYSMDGDIAPLPRFIELKKKYKALLLVDEAHSIGVLGSNGRGIGEHYGVDRNDVDLWMGTMSKSLASCGGYVAGSKTLVNFLKYTAPGFVYSVGISPANSAAALEALRQIQAHPEKIQRLHERSALFLKLARERGIDTGSAGGSAVVPAILGNSLHSLQVSEALRQRGINVQPILYPAVEETAARLRFFVTATHTEQQIRETIEVLAEEVARVRAEGGELQTASV
jgi:8-amino-7-oxononanoate synthase